ncbi:V-type proton ATPase subunit C [Ancistrocladus abbreviatus]
MATRYWVVSLPVKSSASSLWTQLQEAISKQAFDTPVYRFNVPNLRVGTPDSLLALSDDLLKSNSFVEGVTHKIRRQIEDLGRLLAVEAGALTFDGVPIDSYLTRFVSDDAKYPTMSSLREIVDSIHGFASKVEDDLKASACSSIHLAGLPIWLEYGMIICGYAPMSCQVRVAEYNNILSQLNAINRKQTGSLAVRDLSNLVKAEDVITSEHLVTLLAVVSKVKARERGFQIHDFEYSPEAQESRKQELEKLVQDQETLRSSLLQCAYWKSEDESAAMGGLAGEADAHSYVSFTINLV